MSLTEEMGAEHGSGSVDSPARSALARWEMSPWDAAGAVAALLLLVLFLPGVTFPTWTPQFVATLALFPLGLAALVLRCRARTWPAIALAAALGWALLSSLLSDAVRSSLIGFAGRDMSTLSLTACGSMWALGTQLSRRGQDVIIRLVAWTMTTMSLLGVVQVVANIQGGSLALQFDRATAVYSNPVYFGALCAAGAAVIPSYSRTNGRAALFLGLCLGAGVAVSGSRVAAAAMLFVVVAQAAMRRDRRTWIAAASVSVGFAAGVIIDRTFGHGRNAASRLSEQSSSGGRSDVWRYGLEAWGDRPLVGYGPGLFRPSVQGRFDVAFTRDFAPDELSQAWFDPHNVVVHVLVIGGAVMLALLLAWVALWARSARGPLLWSAAAIAVTWLMQPLNMSTVPLACLLFGAAGAAAHEPSQVPKPRWFASLVLVGVALSGWVLVADVALTRAVAQADGDAAAAVAPLYLGDPVVSDIVAQVYAIDGSRDQELEWRRRAVEAEPNRPYWWSQLGRTQLLTGDLEGADRSAQRALALQPYNPRARTLDLLVALGTDDLPRAAEDLRVLCDVDESFCEFDAEQMLEDAAPEP